MLKLADGRPMSFLLESVEGGAVRGRYSLIGLKPDLLWRVDSGKASINRNARQDLTSFEPVAEAPLDSLRALVDECRMDLPDHLPPMAAGLFGFLGYDMVRQIEKLPDANPADLGIPEALMMRPTVIAVFDNIEDMVTVVTPVWPQEGVSADAAYGLAAERLADIVADMGRSLPFRRETAGAARTQPEPVS